jgi:hypothetical protein
MPRSTSKSNVMIAAEVTGRFLAVAAFGLAALDVYVLLIDALSG